MSKAIWIITTISILSIVSFIFTKLKTKYKSNEDKGLVQNELRVNKIYFYIGVVGTIGLTAITIIARFLPTSCSEFEKYLFASLVLLFSFLCGGYLLFFYTNYRIIVFDNYFIYQNFWRIKKQIYFKDIIIDNSKLNSLVRLKKKTVKLN